MIPRRAAGDENVAVGREANVSIQTAGRDDKHACCGKRKRGAAERAEAARMPSAGKLISRDRTLARKPSQCCRG